VTSFFFGADTTSAVDADDCFLFVLGALRLVTIFALHDKQNTEVLETVIGISVA
jgi:hypothetical protein